MKLSSEHGTPRILQHDRGKEFEGLVKKLMTALKVKINRSSAYDPKSQGKVERMHRQLKKKILYDLLSMIKNGANWVSKLPKCNSILNDYSEEELHLIYISVEKVTK